MEFMKDFIFKGMEKNRREFLRLSALGAAGLSLGGAGCASSLNRQPKLRKTTGGVAPNATVSLAAGTDRRENIANALAPFKDTIKRDMAEKTPFIKVNCVVDRVKLCATHPDAVRGILDVLTEFYDGEIVVGESTATDAGTMAVFEEYGYMDLAREYPNVKLVELNDQPTTRQWIMDQHLNPVSIRVINHFLDKNYYSISIAPPKTHEHAIVTLTLKNMAMGAPLKIVKGQHINEKVKMHAGLVHPKHLHFNMFKLAQVVRPDFAILDMYLGMEGEGPVWGTPVEQNCALAGNDFLAVDTTGARMMGFNPGDVGYFYYCGIAGLGQNDPDKIKVVGADLAANTIQYRKHLTWEWTQNWKKELSYPVEKSTWSGNMLSKERKAEILEIQKNIRW